MVRRLQYNFSFLHKNSVHSLSLTVVLKQRSSYIFIEFYAALRRKTIRGNFGSNFTIQLKFFYNHFASIQRCYKKILPDRDIADKNFNDVFFSVQTYPLESKRMLAKNFQSDHDFNNTKLDKCKTKIMNYYRSRSYYYPELLLITWITFKTSVS